MTKPLTNKSAVHLLVVSLALLSGLACEPKPPPEPERQAVMTPVVGHWHEVARIPCDGGPEFIPEDPIREFIVWATGTFRLTWSPFESFVDYYGEYNVDLETNTLTLYDLRRRSGTLPADVDPVGHFEYDPETVELVLRDMWLGTSSRASQPAGCGHRFSGRGS
jgi:hypothetical protein